MRAVVRAALHMQRVFRGYQGRVLRGQRARRVAATMFQCFFRGWVIRERIELGTRMSDEDPQMWRAHANIASLIRALTAVELRRNEFERRSKAAIRFVETNRRAAEVVAAKLIVRETMVSTKPGTTTMGRRWQRLASDRLMRNYRRSEAEAKNQLRLDLAEWAVADAEAKALYVRVAEKQRKVAEVSRMRILTVTAARRLVRWEGVGPRCMLRRRRTRKGGVVVLRTILRQNTRHRSLLQSQVRNQVLFSSEWGEWTTNEKADRAAEAKAAADKEGRVRAAAVLFARPFTQVRLLNISVYIQSMFSLCSV